MRWKKPRSCVLGALLLLAAVLPATAQQVYKCGGGRSVTYTEKPCAGRIVSTNPAPVPVMQNRSEVDLRRLEQNRALARSLRQRPGESAEQFETRRRRARLLREDREECARLDTRIPVEAASLTNPDQEEVAKAQSALRESRKRFSQLRC